MVGGVRRLSRGHGSACTRTHFSGLRFETAYKSGFKIKEAQYFSRKIDIAKYACEQERQGLRAEDALAKL